MKRFYFGLLMAGIALRILFAYRFQSRVWIDEVWVVLNPAYRLLSGTGWLNPGDWQIEIRSWLPPGLLFLVLKTLAVVGITKGTTVLLAVRLLGSGLTILSLVAFLALLQKSFRLKNPPLVAAATLLLTPEFIRFSTSADLSVMALPFLLGGLWLFGVENTSLRGGSFRLGAGALFLSLAVAIRLQFATVPAVVFGFLLLRQQWKKALVLVCAALFVFIFDLALNTVQYGHIVFPLWNYFRVNSVEGLASTYGTTPFFFSFEILWHFMTEPAFLLAVLMAPFALRRSPVLSVAALVFFISHGAIAHKEFRFFYGPAIFLAGVSAAAFQRWLEEKQLEGRSWAVSVGVGFLVLFSSVAFWRASAKVAWAEYEVPSRLETLAGIQPDMRGLITFGWGGIRSGGAYTFYRTLPYEFAENLSQLRARKLDPRLFNYVITGGAEPPPCGEVIQAIHGGVLYRCTDNEIKRLLSPNTGLSGEIP